ncbi:gamma-soluble nsf attachment protein [Anaeramoeba flamelloides]|uniref:Gamma-soluble NSF attachment protein n=1 Tax=Anaeramoeba flamelloides TaxID=1746091 RepID=A0AAV7YZE6_9EUKA|nr:gamma-soluble nsf attachment protein [Anaeramoeba flamelloides]KAJ6244824.1 gamma-soluble nsf attachment protein [Anaeramoeba flamelloides]
MSKKTKRIKEGDKHMKTGLKDITKTFFDRTEDWDSGSSNFLKAAKCYKGAQEWDKCVKALKKASFCNEQNGTLLSAGKNLQEAANILSKKCGNQHDATKLLTKASVFFQEAGKGEAAANALCIAAKVIESIDPEKALQFYSQSFKIYRLEDKEYLCVETYRNAVSLAVKSSKFEIAIKILERMVTLFENLNQSDPLYKTYLSFVVIHLYCDEYKKADQKLQQVTKNSPGFVRSIEFQAANALLDAFENYSEDELEKSKKHQALQYLIVEVGRLAKKIRLGSEIPIQKKVVELKLDNKSQKSSSDFDEDDIDLLIQKNDTKGQNSKRDLLFSIEKKNPKKKSNKKKDDLENWL